MDQITLELTDNMTIGMLRKFAQAMGKQLVVSFEGKRRAQQGDEPPARAGRRRRRRKLSPEARAALARNLEKARAVRLGNLKASKKASKAKGRAAKAAAPKEPAA